MYGHDIVSDILLSIDKSTGAGTVIGSLGFDANFGQGMGWDPATDQLYVAAFNNGTFQAELRIADRTTGNTTLVGVLGSSSPGGLTQLPWLGLELATGADALWLTEDPISGTLDAATTVGVDLMFDTTVLTQTGTYTAELRINGTFENDIEPLTVVMHVVEPDYAVAMSGDMAASGEPGEMVMYTVTITNDGNVEDTFNLAVAGHTWTTTLSENSITLGVGESGTVMVHVTIPATAADGDDDTTTVTATSVNDAAATASADMTTTAVIPPPPTYTLYLPVILKP
jgi:hypothetical protein